MPVERITCCCRVCHKIFTIPPWRKRQGRGHCCSVECWRGRQTNWNEVEFLNSFEVQGECLVWTRLKNQSGYGITHGPDGKRTRAHRIMWMIKNGPIKPGLQVCHKCDNPSCARLDHLFLGTHADNMRDMAQKGRAGMRGMKAPCAKLTDDAVREIRERYSEGIENQPQLARRFGVSASIINEVVSFKRWSHVK